MQKSNLLVVLAGAGAALAWWPVVVEPSPDHPGWLPLVIVALVTAFSTLLSGGHWARVFLASAVGTFSGVCGGWAIWRISDQIAAVHVQHAKVAEFVFVDLLVIAVATLAAAIVSLSAGIAVRRFSLPNPSLRRAIWISLSGTLMLPPIALALTPRLVSLRIERNNHLASIRFEALKRAVEETRSEAGNPDRICDDTLLKRHYSGPPFSESEWRFVTGSHVIEDDYLFGIQCPDEAGRFTIDARPIRDSGHGTRRFCSDESGIVGCRVDWSRPHGGCLPCAK
jgi:hypothetical protein